MLKKLSMILCSIALIMTSLVGAASSASAVTTSVQWDIVQQWVPNVTDTTLGNLTVPVIYGGGDGEFAFVQIASDGTGPVTASESPNTPLCTGPYQLFSLVTEPGAGRVTTLVARIKTPGGVQMNCGIDIHNTQTSTDNEGIRWLGSYNTTAGFTGSNTGVGVTATVTVPNTANNPSDLYAMGIGDAGVGPFGDNEWDQQGTMHGSPITLTHTMGINGPWCESAIEIYQR